MNKRVIHTNNEGNNILDDDNIENFLTISFDAYIPLDDDDDAGDNMQHINDDDLLYDLVNQVPTTSTGELTYIVYE